MLMPGRKYSIANTNYRYGFNGKELDREDPIQYDYGFRIYDPRLGKFKSIDPLTKSYPWLTPYQFSGNSPIRFIDLDGAEIFDPLTKWFATDAAITITTKPKSGKAKVYGTIMGVAGSVEGAVQGAIRPWQSAKALVRMASQSPIQNAIDYGLGMSQKYGDLPEPVQNYAVFGNVGTDMLMTASAFKDIVKPSSIVETSLRNDGIAAKLLNEREQLAKNWGIHSDFVNFTKKVYSETQTKGETLYQYRIPGTQAGSYFVKSLDIKPEDVGLLSSEYTEVYKVTVNKSTESLITTHIENAKYWRDNTTTLEGGGQQIFSPELKSNATFEKINSNGN